MTIITLFLTCANLSEANTIASTLLHKRLVACVKTVPISSQFLWHGSIDSANEILLIMDSEKNKFDTIEKEIKKLHSYETFVLTATEITNASSGVEAWIKKSITP